MKAIYLPCLIIVLLFQACTPGSDINSPNEPNIRPLMAYEREMVFANTRFAIDLFQQLAKSEETNQFFSPYSIHQALAMTMNGNEGEVLDEFIQLLRFEGLSKEEANKAAKELTEFLLKVDQRVKLSIANAIWYREGYQVKVPFVETSQQYYQAEVAPLDMLNPQSVNTINRWIENQTNGLIKDMLDVIPPNAVMYLVNAIYYKADWKYRFDPSKTKKEPFFTSPGQSVQVDMMHLDEAAGFRGYWTADFSYLEIPYSTGQYNMGILMGQGHNLDQITENLTFENLKLWREQATEFNAKLKMPKFKLRHKMDNMRGDLIEMGLERVFYYHPDNFTLLFSNPTDDLKISRVIHDAIIEVDEKGSEAAAATVVEVVEVVSFPPSGPQTIVIDKPFVFFIQEKHSGAILFMGKLGDPGLL
ncbi:serpin family protein [Pararhodonellum marinum]|uniref:serpin family protein n=1 Tax=Pararhodonellum marinum TaxID=2755358 RepID=UPI00188ECD72|nr:serpin family protein [Pararhodonellum marinum]